jgi:methyl-accepting chemotaxis protein
MMSSKGKMPGQTKIQALNQAIEAAQSGKVGRDFAVMADEICKLAGESMTADRYIVQAIQGIQEKIRKSMDNVDSSVTETDESTVLAKKSGEALVEIVRLVGLATDQVRSIATASEQQSAASEEINRSIEDVNTISCETAEAMTQAVSELANQNLNLKSLIEHMQSDDQEKSSPERPESGSHGSGLGG